MSSIKIILFKGKTYKDGSHPVMIRVTNNRKAVRLSTGYKTQDKHWNKEATKFRRTEDNYQVKNAILRDLITRAEQIINEDRQNDKAFSPQAFKDAFSNNTKQTSVTFFLEEIITSLNFRGKVNTANTYVTLKNQLKAFAGKKRILIFSDIDKKLLDKFESYLTKRGCNGGGVSNYMRTLRSTYNKAISDGHADEKYYPFSTSRNRNGYTISKLKSSAAPRALSLFDMERFKSFAIEKHPELRESYLLFLFSYYSRGMNFVDMSYLQKKDISNGRLRYARQKTGGNFNIPLSENLIDILNEFPDLDTDYIFPVLSDRHQTPTQQKNRIKKCLKKMNRDLKDIGELLELEIKLTSYVARHTYATTLKRKKANIGFISQAMGHADVNTTKAYLENFENDEIDKLDDLL